LINHLIDFSTSSSINKSSSISSSFDIFKKTK
jgi:hypothetical protein